MFVLFIGLIFSGFPVAWVLGGLAVLFSALAITATYDFGVYTGIDWAYASLTVKRIWARAVSTSDMESASTYGRVVEEMTSAWSELQLKMWSAWFTTLRELDPEKLAGKGAAMGKAGEMGDLVEKWGKHVQAMVDAQGKLAKEWSEIAGATK